MKFSSLSSGSSGNATFVSSGNTRLLIDCGIPVRTLAARLMDIGEHLNTIDAIVITHAHGDHVGGVTRVLRERMRRGRMPAVYFTRPTADLMDWQGIERPPVKYFVAGGKFEVGDLEIQSFSVMHDCVDPVAFTVRDFKGNSACVAVDLGGVPDAMNYYAKDSQIVLLESNYDAEMLRTGSYPDPLKKRITSESGHLCNAAARNWIRRQMRTSVRHLLLGHISRQNNTPDVVLAGASEALSERGLTIDLRVATHQRATEVIDL